MVPTGKTVRGNEFVIRNVIKFLQTINHINIAL